MSEGRAPETSLEIRTVNSQTPEGVAAADQGAPVSSQTQGREQLGSCGTRVRRNDEAVVVHGATGQPCRNTEEQRRRTRA